MDTTKIYPKRHPQTAGRVIDNEAVLMLSDDSEIHVLNAVGSRVYELADGTNSLAQISQQIAQEFDVSLEQAAIDTQDFLQELLDRNVFVLANQPN